MMVGKVLKKPDTIRWKPLTVPVTYHGVEYDYDGFTLFPKGYWEDPPDESLDSEEAS